MEQLRLHFVEQPLALLTLGQIAHEADELPLPLEQTSPTDKLHRKRAAILALADHDTPHADNAPFAGGEVSRQIAVVLLR